MPGAVCGVLAKIPPRFDPAPIFAALRRHEVEFVLIGGLAAQVHGVEWTTFDADIVIACTESNYEALAWALADLDAEFDTFHQPPIRPDVRRLRSATGTLLFRTKHGRRDVLKEAGGETYETLRPSAAEVADEGVPCASLEAIARMKRAANRSKDRQALPTIEAEVAKRREAHGKDDGETG